MNELDDRLSSEGQEYRAQLDLLEAQLADVANSKHHNLERLLDLIQKDNVCPFFFAHLRLVIHYSINHAIGYGYEQYSLSYIVSCFNDFYERLTHLIVSGPSFFGFATRQ